MDKFVLWFCIMFVYLKRRFILCTSCNKEIEPVIGFTVIIVVVLMLLEPGSILDLSFFPFRLILYEAS